MVEQRRCPLSPFHGESTLTEFAEAFGSGPFEASTFSIRRCSACGLGVTSPVPTADSSHLLYADRTSGDFQPGDPTLVARIKDFFARRDARVFARESPHPRTVLDYACGNGAFARALSKAIPRAEVYATDYHETPPSEIPAKMYVPYS